MPSSTTLANEVSTLDPSAVVAVADNSDAVPSVAQSAPSVTATTAVPTPATTATTTTTKSKSKKKKNSSNMSSTGSQGENTGRWTAEEHRLFLQGLEQHGKGWKKIASLIKSRTVVQIRTHAQKYFQKLAKARQNGEEGEITMEGRGGVASVTSASSMIMMPKRRKQVTGTKRKAIQSVVASAQRQGKKLAAAQAAAGVPNPMAPLPAVAPTLAYFTLPPDTEETDEFTGQPPISGLEDAIFRFLTPCPPQDDDASVDDTQVNDVARQAGANPITLPSGNQNSAAEGGEISPTGVYDLSIYPPWTDSKEPPSWYAKGADIDALLDVGDALDWLADNGDPTDTYEAPPDDEEEEEEEPSEILMDCTMTGVKTITSASTLPRVDSNMEHMVPSLPSIFHNDSTDNLLVDVDHSSGNLKPSPSGASMLETHLQVFDSPMEEHAFVSTILENDRESSDSLPDLEE